MDIYCPVCAEPWEIDSLHDVAGEEGRTFSQVRSEFFASGCGVAFAPWGITCKPATGAAGHRAMISAMLADILGDDIDGIALELEDAERMGLW
jgi:hypothetical protein